jgi:hypothetical protein
LLGEPGFLSALLGPVEVAFEIHDAQPVELAADALALGGWFCRARVIPLPRSNKPPAPTLRQREARQEVTDLLPDDLGSAMLEVSEQQERQAVEQESSRDDAESKRIQALGEQLARHARYAEADSEARLRFVAQQLFPKEDDITGIVTHAEMLYWWDVEPKEREQTAKKVRKLYDSCVTMHEIAGRLNMSAERASKLVAQTEK